MLGAMKKPAAPQLALAAATFLPEGQDVPEWVHLFPRGTVETYDGRGPFELDDPEAVIRESLTHKARVVIDENHSTDLAAKAGLPAPARGYIVEMQARADGIWARVEWNGAGKELLQDRAYWGISPVFQHDGKGRVIRILRASLTNDPALRGLAALATEEPENPTMKSIAARLGLAEDATEEQILAAIDKLKEKPKTEMAAETTLAAVGTALGVEGSDGKAILAAARLVKAGTGAAEDLKTELAAVKGELDGLKQAEKRRASETYIDQALREGRAGVNKGNREELVLLHMETPKAVEQLIGGAPRLIGSGSNARVQPPAPKDGEIALSHEQRHAAKLLGIAEKDFATTLAAERNEESV